MAFLLATAILGGNSAACIMSSARWRIRSLRFCSASAASSADSACRSKSFCGGAACRARSSRSAASILLKDCGICSS
ncbi:uncharacterized protein IUM83_17433 [Phytophthora cinnamomi]|uniref:uncharacterized protein n=1 Tax=Phytophthora cinnamomi TaxID=4785 RepID=UPI00355A1950|nr:hypothetical protein IUM83_17433 [Phytophthora cinnamomi]